MNVIYKETMLAKIAKIKMEAKENNKEILCIEVSEDERKKILAEVQAAFHSNCDIENGIVMGVLMHPAS